MSSESKPLVAVILSLASATVFLFLSVTLNVSQPYNYMMVSGLITIFIALLLLQRPKQHISYGILIILSSAVSLLGILLSAPWNHVIIWNGKIIQYQPDLALHIMASIFPAMLGIFGGVLSIMSQFLELRIGKTPKSFMKECMDCKKEIPIASEQCPHCGSAQKRP